MDLLKSSSSPVTSTQNQFISSSTLTESKDIEIVKAFKPAISNVLGTKAAAFSQKLVISSDAHRKYFDSSLMCQLFLE